jgi:hypothetical protein
VTEVTGVDGEESRSGQRRSRREAKDSRESRRRGGREQRETREKGKRVTYSALVAFSSIFNISVSGMSVAQLGPCMASSPPLDQLKRTLADQGLYSPPKGDSPASHDDPTLLSVPSFFSFVGTHLN